MASFGHPSKFERVWLRYCTDVAHRCEPNFARCLAVSCGGILRIHFRWLLSPNGILPAAKFTLRSSLLISYISSFLHGSRAVDVSQSLRRGTRNGITDLSRKAPSIFGRAAITLGIGPHSSCIVNAVLSYGVYTPVNHLHFSRLQFSRLRLCAGRPIITSGQSNLTRRPHRRCTWTVQSHSPGCFSVGQCAPPANNASLDSRTDLSR